MMAMFAEMRSAPAAAMKTPREVLLEMNANNMIPIEGVVPAPSRH